MENDLKEFKKEQIYLGAEVSEEPQIIMQEGGSVSLVSALDAVQVPSKGSRG